MSEKSALRDFIISQDFIRMLTLVIAVFNGINVVYSILSKTPLNLWVTIGGIIILILSIFFTYINWKNKQMLSLIEGYKAWMIPLGVLTKNPSIIWQFIIDDLGFENLHPCCLDYYKYKANELGKRYHELKAELDRLSNPYLLNENRINSITKKMKEFLIDYRRMHGILINKITTENIPLKGLRSYFIIRKANSDLHTVLNQSRGNIAKITDEFEKETILQGDLFIPFPELKA